MTFEQFSSALDIIASLVSCVVLLIVAFVINSLRNRVRKLESEVLGHIYRVHTDQSHYYIGKE